MTGDTHYLKQELNDRFRSDPQLLDWLESGSLDGMWFWDLEHPEHEWFSLKFKQLFGYGEEEVPHSSEWWQNNIFPEDLPSVLDNFKKHCQDPGYAFDQIVRYRHKNGSTVWVRCRGKALFDQQGKPVRMLGAHSDITSLMEIKEQLDDVLHNVSDWAAARQALFDAMLDSVIVIDQYGTIEEFNTSTVKLFGYTKEELLGSNIKMLMGMEDASQHDRHLSNHVKTGHANIIGKGRESLARKKSGELFYVFLSVATYTEEDSTKFVGTLRDINDEVKRRHELEFAAKHDPLTGLPTRRALGQSIEAAITGSLRNDRCFYLLYIDLNKFKPINDKFGHEVGDQVLKVVAKRLRNAVREGDLSARVGGDEFVILTEPSVAPWDIEKLIAKIRQSLLKPISLEGNALAVGASIGVAKFPEDGDSAAALLKSADTRMYQEKSPRNGSKTRPKQELVAVTYISHSLVANSDMPGFCREIERISSTNNAKQGISGILLSCSNRFVQRLEGPRKAIDNLIDRIRKDQRHRYFSILCYEVISKRSYDDWSQMQVITSGAQVALVEDLLLNVELHGADSLNEQEAQYLIDLLKENTQWDRF